MTMIHKNSLLLIGPTGSGKTPLGELCQKRGFYDKRCIHFDFGENLRRAAESDPEGSQLDKKDIEFIKKMLAENALLENRDFHIAERIILSFLKRSSLDEILILNGIPRHAEQAEKIDRFIHVRGIVNLVCSPETVYERIYRDTGGDRGSRYDDSMKEITKKLEIFNTRTLPLIDHYRKKGAFIKQVLVEADTSPDDMHSTISKDMNLIRA